jgi:hypothetical protein
MATLAADSSNDGTPAVSGEHSGGGVGVFGKSKGFNGVLGRSDENAGVSGVSEKFAGVWAESHGDGHAGVFGISHHGPGVVGESNAENHAGVWGKGSKWSGVVGTSVDQTGVSGVSEKFVGIWAETKAANHAALFAVARPPGKLAGRFEGDVEVTGDLILTGADVAEQFDVTPCEDDVDAVSPGTVVVLDERGALAPCGQAYDNCVAGVVSGAGDRVPALVLDRQGPEPCGNRRDGRRAVAVVGKVWCRADASRRPIRVGDLLTTSATVGHAMAAVDRDAAFGAVLGKALTPLASATGLVLVLVGLG